jgi:MFS family permease
MRFGRRQYFFASIAIFTFASFMCGLSHDLWPLVFWRVIQGAGGGGLLSQAQAILGDTFPRQARERWAMRMFRTLRWSGPTPRRKPAPRATVRRRRSLAKTTASIIREV